MSGSARITSIDAVRDFRARLGSFEEEASGALSAAEIDVRRTLDWLRHEQQPFWKSEIRKREETLTQARSALSRAQSLTSDLSPKSFVDEKKAVDRAKQAVAVARQKLDSTKRWHREMERALDTYKAGVNRLERQLSAGIPAASARLAQTSDRLHEYVAETAPRGHAQDAEAGRPAIQAGSPREPGGMARSGGPGGDDGGAVLRWSDLTPLRADRRRVTIDRAAALPDGDADTLLGRRATGRLSEAIDGMGDAADACPSHDRVVVAKGWWRSETLLCARSMKPAIGDTGWYLGPVDADGPPDPSALAACRVEDLTEAAPWIAPLLSLPRGSVALVRSGAVVALCDDRGNPLAAADGVLERDEGAAE